MHSEALERVPPDVHLHLIGGLDTDPYCPGEQRAGRGSPHECRRWHIQVSPLLLRDALVGELLSYHQNHLPPADPQEILREGEHSRGKESPKRAGGPDQHRLSPVQRYFPEEDSGQDRVFSTAQLPPAGGCGEDK